MYFIVFYAWTPPYSASQDLNPALRRLFGEVRLAGCLMAFLWHGLGENDTPTREVCGTTLSSRLYESWYPEVPGVLRTARGVCCDRGSKALYPALCVELLSSPTDGALTNPQASGTPDTPCDFAYPGHLLVPALILASRLPSPSKNLKLVT